MACAPIAASHRQRACAARCAASETGRVRRGGGLQMGDDVALHPNATHGGTGTREYFTWRAMIERCECPTNKDYRNYGARGISVCKKWRSSFAVFRSDLGPRPIGTTIDRIDVNGNYEPGNCRWATARQQANNRRETISITAMGKTLPMSEWARITGLGVTTIWYRLSKGYSQEDAVSIEKRKRWKRCSKGHEYTTENTIVFPGGCKKCRVCYRATYEIRKASGWKRSK